jgi:hypothetical protein
MVNFVCENLGEFNNLEKLKQSFLEIGFEADCYEWTNLSNMYSFDLDLLKHIIDAEKRGDKDTIKHNIKLFIESSIEAELLGIHLDKIRWKEMVGKNGLNTNRFFKVLGDYIKIEEKARNFEKIYGYREGNWQY